MGLFSITRDGKRGFLGIFKHKYKSVTRFYNQNFWDFHKMNLIDLLLEKDVAKVETVTIPGMVEERKVEFCSKDLLDIYIWTWKAPKKIPSSLPLIQKNGQLLVIGIQESTDDEQWARLIEEIVDRNQYIEVSRKISNHNILIIYALNAYRERISNIELAKVKFKSGYNQYLSSKCAILIRMMVDSTRICFAGCQMAFGKDYSSHRLHNFRQIHKDAFQEVGVGQKISHSIEEDDVVFIFGNTNTNIENHD